MKRQVYPTSQQLFILTQDAIRNAPKFIYEQPLGENEYKWLAQASALINALNNPHISVDFEMAKKSINTYSHSRDKLLQPLYDAYYHLELHAPSDLTGKFIPPGDSWNGYAALIKLMQQPCEDLLLIDPYISADLFLYFLPHVNAKNGVRCLTTKQNQYHHALVAAKSKWENDDISELKPVEIRYAPFRTLHDRFLIIDKKHVWLISQSVKDIAKNSAATLTLADDELSELKVSHYEHVWSDSDEITNVENAN